MSTLEHENNELKRKIRDVEDRLLDILRHQKSKFYQRTEENEEILKSLRALKGKESFFENFCKARDTERRMKKRALEENLINFGHEDWTLEKTLKRLEEEGFEKKSRSDNDKGTGIYTLLAIPNFISYDSYDNNRMRDYGYEITEYETSLNIDLDKITGRDWRGGRYTGIAIFEGEKNITNKIKEEFPYCHFNCLIPRGSMTMQDGKDAIYE